MISSLWPGKNFTMYKKLFSGRIVPHTIFFFLSLTIFNGLSAQGFLRTDGKKIVNAKGQNVLLRGEGLGGWMLQEGYMLGIYKDAQQNKIRSRIEELMGSEETEEFYDAWLHNFIQKVDIDSMHAWGFNSVRLPMHYNLIRYR